ncbi:MAG TPA: ABC transporter substrate-binding protein [Chloroflexota bacterium]|nr:ABC transporter substrate-binding protein [Chloroflexota bacterium]
MPSLAAKPIQSLGLTSGSQTRLFNAGLVLPDDRGLAQPYLADTLPLLGTDSWQVFADGRMETTYHLRSGLTWHDGHPLTASDFVFSWHVYAVPQLGQATSPPVGLMEEVLAPDDRTVLIRWKRLYPDAGALEAAGGGGTSPSFPALPRHILEPAFAQANWDQFAALPYWSTEFIGLGPYRLDRWEPGTFLEGVAFDGHALGRPNIERIRVTWVPDFNTTLANLLAGEAHMTIDDSIRFQQGLILRQRWSPLNAGSVLVYPGLWRWTQIQQRAEYADPRELRDPNVRRALAYAVDKETLNAALFEGEGIMTENPVPPTADYFADVDRAATKYPFDVRRSEQLMSEAGFRKAANGVFVGPRGAAFETELAVLQSPQNETEMSIMASTWRQAGFRIEEVVWPAVQARDGQLRNTNSGLSTTSGPAGEATLADHASSEIPRPDNRWSGSNRGGWVNPEFDGLVDRLNSTLDRADRVGLLSDMARIFSEDAAVISLYFNPTTTAVAAGLTGPQPVVPTSDVAWNVHLWTFH